MARAVSAREATADAPPMGPPVSSMAAQPVITSWSIALTTNGLCMARAIHAVALANAALGKGRIEPSSSSCAP
eukprot:4598353-Pyramimonas_sp.AAC.1